MSDQSSKIVLIHLMLTILCAVTICLSFCIFDLIFTTFLGLYNCIVLILLICTEYQEKPQKDNLYGKSQLKKKFSLETFILILEGAKFILGFMSLFLSTLKLLYWTRMKFESENARINERYLTAEIVRNEKIIPNLFVFNIIIYLFKGNRIFNGIC